MSLAQSLLERREATPAPRGASSALSEAADARRRVFDLVQPCGGLFDAAARVRALAGEPRLTTRIARLGDLSQVGVPIPVRPGERRAEARLAGAGTGLDETDALLPALVEGLERYSNAVYRKEQFVWASADELGADALDLDSIARCSPAELARPRCPISAPTKSEPIRWVRGLSLLDGRTAYVPAVMVYLYVGVASPAERFWLTITTGCAAHVSYERAVLGAILEVIERDALSITWLQQLRLPKLDIDQVSDELAPYWERYQRSSPDLEYVLFDATTDLGVPTVYGLQTAGASERARTLVSCSTDLSPSTAVAKVIRDMAAARLSMRHARPVPESWEDFEDLSHGATFMAGAAQAPAFEFLLGSPDTRRLSDLPSIHNRDGAEALRAVLQILRTNGLEAYAVDLSTDEALRCGIRVVRVVIPGLQPLSVHYRARYLGHPRLYDAPRAMGHPVRAEAELNHWPQPFA